VSDAMEYSVVALGLSVACLPLAVVLLWLLLKERTLYLRTATPLLGFIILMLCIGATLGAYGRVIDGTISVSLDYWIRVLIVATRVAVVGGMLYDIRWLLQHRSGG
jgi:hypothetical protein